MLPLRIPPAALKNLSHMEEGGGITVNSLSWAHLHVMAAQASDMLVKKPPDDTDLQLWDTRHPQVFQFAAKVPNIVEQR